MKLLVRRNQKQVKGWLGGDKGITFSLFVKGEFEPEELALIQKYKFDDALLHSWETRKPGGDADDLIYHRVYVSSLTNGKEFEASGIGELLLAEAKIIEAAQEMKQYLEAASTFGGERVIAI